jgi:hypothetical protein
MWIRGPQALLETIIPYYGNTIQLTIQSVDLVPGRITAEVSVHVGDTGIGIHSVDSIEISDARLLIIPSGGTPSFTVTAGSKTFSGTARPAFMASYYPSAPITLSYQSQSFTNGDTSLQFSVSLIPTKNVIGKYTFQDGANMLYYIQWYGLGGQQDSSYRSQLDPSDIEITSYDPLTRKIAGTFTATLVEDDARTKFDVSGSFTNITLEDF